MARLLAVQILSLFLIMGSGFLLVKTRKLRREESRALSVLNVYLLMPCIIINSFRMTYSKEIRDNLMLVAAAAVLVNVFFMLMTALLRKRLCLTAVEIAAIRYPNAGNLIIPLVASVLGQEWVIYASTYFCVHMVFLWTFGPSLLKGKRGVDLKGMITNPNIVAVIIGFVLFGTQIQLPVSVQNALSGLSSMVGPACMLMIGMVLAGLDLKKELSSRRLYLIFALRMLVFPVLICLLLKYCGIKHFSGSGETLLLIVLLSASAPTATVVSQMAQLYGQDESYASVITAVTTLGCIVTMPLMAMLYQALP